MQIATDLNRRLRPRAAVLLLAAIVASGTVLAGPALPGPLASGPLGAPVARAADPGIQPRIAGIAPLSRQVYGYLPYWRLDAGTVDRLDYDLVSTIAFFGLGIKADGSIDTAWRGYTAYVSDAATAVTNAAHAKGVRVVPTFQLFDSGSLPKLTAFLGSTAAQNQFIAQALALMAARSADGANIDFEPLPASFTPGFLAFVQRFGTRMRAAFPGSTLVVATSAGAGAALTTGLVPLVDQMFVMTYNYHWSGSTVTGPIAPLDNATRSVKIHIARFLTRAPASKIIMGVPYYGYDWPVTSQGPNASVQPNRAAFGGVWSVTYASAMNWLALHPEVPRLEDTVQGSAYFTYWDATKATYRQVYFEDELSAAAKYDYAIASGLAGIGIWTLDGDRGYSQMNDLLRAKFYAPIHAATSFAKVGTVSRLNGRVRAYIARWVVNTGTVPEVGVLSWKVYDPRWHLVLKGSQKMTVYPGRAGRVVGTVVLGSAAALRSGTYRLYVRFTSSKGVWMAPPVTFRQPY